MKQLSQFFNFNLIFYLKNSNFSYPYGYNKYQYFFNNIQHD